MILLNAGEADVVYFDQEDEEWSQVVAELSFKF